MSHSPAKREQPADVTVAALLEALDCGRATLYRYIDRGLIPPPVVARRGRPVLWHRDVLKRAIKIRKLLEQGYTLAAVEQRLGESS